MIYIDKALKEELKDDNSVVAKFATTAKDGKKYSVEYYNLDVKRYLHFVYI